MARKSEWFRLYLVIGNYAEGASSAASRDGTARTEAPACGRDYGAGFRIIFLAVPHYDHLRPEIAQKGAADIRASLTQAVEKQQAGRRDALKSGTGGRQQTFNFSHHLGYLILISQRNHKKFVTLMEADYSVGE